MVGLYYFARKGRGEMQPCRVGSGYALPFLFWGVAKLKGVKMLLYSPVNEQEVVFLFARICDELNLKIKRVKTEFPDCIAIDKDGNETRIEFELYSSNFLLHKHPLAGCNLLVTWVDDIDLKGRIKVLELKEYFPHLTPEKTSYNKRINKTIEGLRLIAKGEASRDNLLELFKTYHPKEREKEPIRFIARLIINGGEPFIKDGKIALRKPIDLQMIKYSVSKNKNALNQAKKILEQIGLDFK
jgi:hypothetical protein